MDILLIVFFCIIWYVIGVSGFIFWWTKEYDLTSDTLPFMFFTGLTGPLSWVLGFLIHGNYGNVKTKKIIFKKRD